MTDPKQSAGYRFGRYVLGPILLGLGLGSIVLLGFIILGSVLGWFR